MTEVLILREAKRGCGYRKAGPDGTGLYLMGEITWSVCERLPFPLTVCPCCGAGVKHTRAFRWIEPTKLFAPEFDFVIGD